MARRCGSPRAACSRARFRTPPLGRLLRPSPVLAGLTCDSSQSVALQLPEVLAAEALDELRNASRFAKVDGREGVLHALVAERRELLGGIRHAVGADRDVRVDSDRQLGGVAVLGLGGARAASRCAWRQQRGLRAARDPAVAPAGGAAELLRGCCRPSRSAGDAAGPAARSSRPPGGTRPRSRPARRSRARGRAGASRPYAARGGPTASRAPRTPRAPSRPPRRGSAGRRRGWSMLAMILACSTGCRIGTTSTETPSSTRSVTAARKASVVSGSRNASSTLKGARCRVLCARRHDHVVGDPERVEAVRLCRAGVRLDVFPRRPPAERRHPQPDLHARFPSLA